MTWQHRTIENYVTALTRHGLVVTALRECEPRPDRFADADADELERRRRVPLFLLLGGRV